MKRLVTRKHDSNEGQYVTIKWIHWLNKIICKPIQLLLKNARHTDQNNIEPPTWKLDCEVPIALVLWSTAFFLSSASCCLRAWLRAFASSTYSLWKHQNWTNKLPIWSRNIIIFSYCEKYCFLEPSVFCQHLILRAQYWTSNMSRLVLRRCEL